MAEISNKQQRFMNAVIETTKVVIGLFQELSVQIVAQNPEIPEVQNADLKIACDYLHAQIVRANYVTEGMSAEELWAYIATPNTQELLPLTSIAGSTLHVLGIRHIAAQALYNIEQQDLERQDSSLDRPSNQSDIVARYYEALVTSIAVAATTLTGRQAKRPYSAAHIERAREKSAQAYKQYLVSNSLD